MLQEILFLTLGLLFAIVVFVTVAVRVQVPAAILLVLGGILISFIPAIPDIVLDPDIVLVLFLPPLIFSAAWFTSWRNFRQRLNAILLLAVGLVLFTMVCVAFVAHTLIPGMTWPVAYVLGAVVAPTDTVAANAILKTSGVARGISTVVEGESLVNDATALVCYRFAIAAVVSGTFSFWNASLQFVLVSAGGILVGLVIAWLLCHLFNRIIDAPREITLTVLTPFVVYLVAESFELSGVLAAVAGGLYLGRKSATFFTSNTRLQADSFWNVLVFILNGFIFLLVGLQLSIIMRELAGQPLLPLLGYAIAVCLTVILARLIWPFGAVFILRFLNRFSWAKGYYPDFRNTLVVGWTGMRGGVSLATALAIPLTVANGSAFPLRSLIIFLTFCVILATLLLQGLTLEPLIRWLGLGADPTEEEERKEARLAIAQAAVARIDVAMKEDWTPKTFARQLRAYYQATEQIIPQEMPTSRQELLHQRHTGVRRLQREVRQAEREKAIQLRDTGKIDDEVFHQIERDLDLEDQRFQKR